MNMSKRFAQNKKRTFNMTVLSVAIMFASPIAQSPKLGDFFMLKL